MASMIAGIVSLTLSVVLIAGVYITTVKNQNTTGWTTSEVALWGLLSLAAIAGMVYGTLAVFGIA
jgi:hypothetical protein